MQHKRTGRRGASPDGRATRDRGGALAGWCVGECGRLRPHASRGAPTFLIYKSTVEIYHKTEGQHEKTEEKTKTTAKFKDILIQILLLDIVFSVDSIITAVGMVQQIWIMYAAVIISVLIMLLSAKSIADFINRHPSFKILALSFLMVIGVSLVAEGMHYHLPKGYIYFGMAFSFLVDLLQLRAQKHESK